LAGIGPSQPYTQDYGKTTVKMPPRSAGLKNGVPEEGWVGQAHQWDMRQAERCRKEWEDVAATERFSRRMERVELARLCRRMVMRALVDQETRRPINLLDLSPAMINALSRFVLAANHEERLDIEASPEPPGTSSTWNATAIVSEGGFETIRVRREV
jgi:hypothetical protein